MRKIWIMVIALLIAAINVNAQSKAKTEKATFGMGCFWCTEAIFQQLKGVKKVESGYSGGTVSNPTYEDVSSGQTGHAEVIQVTYDPAVISYKDLLEVFWKMHDATTLNRQGADVGTQYRSVIFYSNANQKSLAEKYKNELNGQNAFGKPAVTQIAPLKNFYKAEDYHQNYYKLNGSQPYCRIVIKPKMDKLEKIFKDKLK